MDGYTIELMCCESVLMQTIEAPKVRQKDVACVYAAAMASSECRAKLINWKRVNEAIINRWSLSGLERIKKQAWSGKCFE